MLQPVVWDWARGSLILPPDFQRSVPLRATCLVDHILIYVVKSYFKWKDLRHRGNEGAEDVERNNCKTEEPEKKKPRNLRLVVTIPGWEKS